MNKKYGLVTGSFDPITVGHVDIIMRAASIFDRVTVVVADNPDKSYMFTPGERAEIVKAAISHIEGVDVQICSGLVADFAKEHGASAFVRGIRDGRDVAYEQNMAEINFENSGVDTVMLFAKPCYYTVSSTAVRMEFLNGHIPENLMTSTSLDKATELLKAKSKF